MKAELNLKQIINRLEQAFTGEGRRLIFWYDDKADFAEDMQELTLDNAKVYFLEKDNQFYTKYFLERVDTTTNYLIYAPFPKPDVRENHLEDTLLYSKRFYADRASLIVADLKIDEKYKPVIEKYKAFFANKKRIRRFYDLEMDHYDEKTIPLGIMTAICTAQRACSFEAVMQSVLVADTLVEKPYLHEFEKYGLLQDFWKCCEQYFGYSDAEPTLEKLVITLYITYAMYTLPEVAVPDAWKPFMTHKAGNIIAFLNNMMNSVLYQEEYDKLSSFVAQKMQVAEILKADAPEKLLDCDVFFCVDQILLEWLVGRLLAEDTMAELDGLNMVQVCEKRQKMHFSKWTSHDYDLLKSAYVIVCVVQYHCPDGLPAMIKHYQAEGYQIDRAYRAFYEAYDALENTALYETLRERVENIYTNRYLSVLLPKWNAGLREAEDSVKLPLQRHFYQRFIKPAKERTVVIISDAMRYEVGRELFDKLQDDAKCTVDFKTLLGVLPSYTRLGMAALLPHQQLDITDAFEVQVDGSSCDNLADRQAILQADCAESCCVRFDDLKNKKKADLREIFTGKQVVYVYHNQIDARGDKANTEDEVFIACAEAVKEISSLIKRIASNANTYHFFVTADHGFIYKRDKLEESDKIRIGSKKEALVNRRFIISQKPIIEEGVYALPLSKVLGHSDEKYVSYPAGSTVFKVAGGGQNYVHGGSSPQELLLPLIEVKVERGHMETHPAPIALVSTVQKVTNLIVTLDFIQSEPVSDMVKAADYRIYFISEDNEKISDEAFFAADSRESDPMQRIVRLRFTFKNKKYDKDKNYYLVAVDEATGLEAFRYPIVMDLAFSDDESF